MSLPLSVSVSVDLFNEKIAVYTVDEVVANHIRQEGNRVDFVITGTIQTEQRQVAALNEQGAQADGFLALHTRWVLPAYNSVQGAEKRSQTYVFYGDEVWKVNRLTNWRYKTQKVNIYALEKYQRHEGLYDDNV